MIFVLDAEIGNALVGGLAECLTTPDATAVLIINPRNVSCEAAHIIVQFVDFL